MTGLAIVLTQSYTTGLDGAAMTTHAFSVGLFIPLIGKYIVNIGLVFFAFTTIIGWNYYGERCMYCLLYTSPSPRDISGSRMPSSA